MTQKRVAVIIDDVPGSPVPLKALVSRDKTMGELMVWVRVHAKMDSKKALFMFIGGGVLPSSSATVGSIYDEHKSREDGCLHINLKVENTFG